MHNWQFIEETLIRNAVHASFLRGNIYTNPERDKRSKPNLYKDIYAELRRLAERYTRDVSETQHVKNIESFAQGISARHRKILVNGRFRIGTSQKALNLYLKYLWCLKKIATPPHCPFDAKIIAQVDLQNNIQWTRMDRVDEYRELVTAAKIKMEKTSYKSLAEWELRTFAEIYT